MASKKQLNVRIEPELYDKVQKDEEPAVKIVTEALRQHFKKKLSKVILNDRSLLSIRGELEFHNWFTDNYSLLGFDRLIKQSTKSYPDFVLEKDGMEVRVELETLSSNFEKHGHDPSLVDLVICLKIDKELPVETLELPIRFDPKTLNKTTNITIRIDNELWEMLEQQRGGMSKAEFYRGIIERHLQEHKTGASDFNKSEEEKIIKYYKEQVEFLREMLNKSIAMNLSLAEGQPKKRARELLETSPQDKPEPKSKSKSTGIWRKKREGVYTGQPSPS